MTAFALDIQDFTLISGELLLMEPAIQPWTGYRVKHVPEGGRPTPDGMPCVNPSLNIAGIPFNSAMQLMSWDLAYGFNPGMRTDKWRVVYGGGVAFCNGQGFDMSGDPRADYVNSRNLDKDLPKLMKAIICSGNFFTGQISGNELVMTPGVDAIDGTKPMPSASEIVTKHWYFHATTARQTSTGWKVSNFPQGSGAPVLVPYILREQARYPLQWFAPWNDFTLPDPLKIYHPTVTYL